MELMEQVKTGFKKTEIGLIPKDWQVLNLGSSSTLKARIGWQGLTTAEYLNSGDYFLVTGTDFQNGFIDWDNCVYVEKDRYDQDKNIQLKKEDVLVTKDGTIGKVAYINRVLQPTTLNSGVFVIRPKGCLYDPNYFYYVLRSSVFQEFLSKLSAGSTINHLYQKDFVFFDFPAPPSLEEQKAIATALSDTDDLIASLEKLIAKKKAIKQGAMQQLLTPPSKGGNRLPGFSGEWEEKAIFEVAEVKSGKRLPKGNALLKSETPFPYIRVMDMNPGGVDIRDIHYVPEDIYSQIGNYRIYKEDIFISVAGTLGIVGIIPDELDGANLTENANRFTNIQCSQHFLLYVLLSPLVQNEIQSASTLGAQPKLALTRIRNFKIDLPPSMEEQIAIANVLNDMDKEIEALESKKAKYEQIKQGMMQELLTGKTRLI